jgi:hypothetical protein
VLRKIKPIRSKGALSADHGNVQSFLEALIVELVAANYRHFLHEQLINSDETYLNQENCSPPLLAKESQVSGLFAGALAAICPISRPEVPIKRAKGMGHIDFTAFYGSRYLGIELKQVSISMMRAESGRKKKGSAGQVVLEPKGGLLGKWKELQVQTAEGLAHMRATPKSYPHPIGVGLMVIKVSQKVREQADAEEVREEAVDRMSEVTEWVRKTIKPNYVICYQAPTEMQTFTGFGKSGNEYRVFPGLIFAAAIKVKLAAGTKQKKATGKAGAKPKKTTGKSSATR